MPRSGRRLGGRARGDVLHGDVVDRDLNVILLPPVLCELVEPCVVRRDEVTPLHNCQRLGVGQCPRYVRRGEHRRCTGGRKGEARFPQEPASRDRCKSLCAHLGFLLIIVWLRLDEAGPDNRSASCPEIRITTYVRPHVKTPFFRRGAVIGAVTARQLCVSCRGDACAFERARFYRISRYRFRIVERFAPPVGACTSATDRWPLRSSKLGQSCPGQGRVAAAPSILLEAWAVSGHPQADPRGVATPWFWV